MYTLQRCPGTICSLSPFCVGAFNFRRAPAFRKASVENQNVASVGMPTSISTPCSTLLTEVEYYSEHKSCSLRLHEQLHLAASCKTKYSPQVEGVSLSADGCAGSFHPAFHHFFRPLDTDGSLRLTRPHRFRAMVGLFSCAQPSPKPSSS